MSKTSLKTTVEWNNIPWRKLARYCYKLQKRIYRASQRGDVKAIRSLQKTLMKSWSAKCLAVRRVTQDNQGKKTAGVDGLKSLAPKARLTLVKSLNLGFKAAPTRRVWIPKPGSEEKRPLGIPTIYDRALQALVKMALEPEWEALFEPNSYGFRPGRSCQDAIEAIFIAINHEPKFVLDADISKCFDKINQKALLEKIHTYPSLRRQIKAWLKAGVMDSKQLFPTKEGTPQGNVISPLLANIALHGMENRIKQAFPRSRTTVNGKRVYKCLPPNVIRYADDFVILHKDISVIQKCKEIITDWLKGMGLELKPSKTRLAHTLERHEEEESGFDFLGFNVKQYHAGKYRSGKNKEGELLGYKTVITPSTKKRKVHYEQIAKIIDDHISKPQEALIAKLAPIIIGWTRYYASVSSRDTFEELDNLVYSKLRAWSRKRHPNKGGRWITDKYWQTIGSRNWVFANEQTGSNPMQLPLHTDRSIVRHTKVKGEASPYDGNLVYWSTRMGKHPETTPKVATLLKRQKGKCAQCGLYIKDGDLFEVDHIQPKALGGKDGYKNLQILHRHCHDIKTAIDIKGMRDKHQITEEPYEVKASRTVLEPSMNGDIHA